MSKEDILLTKISKEIEKNKNINENTSSNYYSSEKLHNLLEKWNKMSDVEKSQQEEISGKKFSKIIENYNSDDNLGNLIILEKGKFVILKIKNYESNLALSNIKKNQLILFTQINIEEQIDEKNVKIGDKIILDIPNDNSEYLTYRDINKFFLFNVKYLDQELKFIEDIYKTQPLKNKKTLIIYLDDYMNIHPSNKIEDLINKLLNIGENNKVDIQFKTDLTKILMAKNKSTLQKIYDTFAKKINDHNIHLGKNPKFVMIYACTLMILIKIIISGTYLTKSLIFIIIYFTGLNNFLGNPEYLQ